MLNIFISPKYFEEKSYIISILIDELLGLEYKLHVDDKEKDYRLTFGESELIIEDHFFKDFDGSLSYLDQKNIPTNLSYGKNEFTPEDDIPIIFGTDKIIIGENKIICGNDIFSGSFFLLSRWEEYVVPERDVHNRFTFINSFMNKLNVIHRPIVNEYSELLWNLLLKLGFNLERKKCSFEFIATHDVDQPLRLINFKVFSRSILKSLLLSWDVIEASNNIYLYPLNKFNLSKDPANTYDILMDCSDEVGIKSIFNFQNSKVTRYDWGYKNDSKFMQDLFKKIKERNHAIGFHPSYYSYNNPELWEQEYKKLCELTETEIKIGRQHFLRFENPLTWQIWEYFKMDEDYTLGFAQQEGFRCGICNSYSTYDILNRKKLRLKETPLILMEKTLMSYQRNGKPKVFAQKMKSLADKVKKYNGKFVFLWHNSSFSRKTYTPSFYKKLIVDNSTTFYPKDESIVS